VRAGRDGRCRRGKGPAWVLAALGSLLVLAAFALPMLDRGSSPTQRGTGAVTDGGPAQAPALAGHHGTTAVARRAAPDAGRPIHLAIPSLAVSAPVTPVELDGAALVPPADPQVLGWWSNGGVAGASRGTTVIAGHTVHTGGGAFDHLADLGRGDVVRVVTESGTVEYAVTTVTIFSKASLAAHAEHVFSQSVPGRLALVTCDDWNGTDYESNAVVLATPLRSR
jgi:LPXTG-site transpeptidase (sortase) family protein